MGKMSSLATAFSGLKAAQTGLMVTGHNVANSETPGYVRQQSIQMDVFSQTIGVNARGKMQVGLGSDIASVRQIRNNFLDVSYRREVGKLGFYNTKAQVGRDMETIIGELQSEDRMEAVISDLRSSLYELSVYQPGLDTRENFISTCITFVTKVNSVYDSMNDAMNSIDEQIIECVNEVNGILNRVNELNSIIKSAEINGDTANDYRDERNLCLDRLSLLIPAEYVEINKEVRVFCEGKELVANGTVNHIGFKYCVEGYPYIEPIITNSNTILSASTPASNYKPLFNLTGPVDSTHKNDSGELKALLACRGYVPTNYAFSAENFKPDYTDTVTYPKGKDDPKYQSDYLFYQKMVFNEEYALIPRIMKEFDILVNSIVKLINDVVSPYKEVQVVDPKDNSKTITVKVKDPNAPFGLDGSQYDEIFVREYHNRFTDTTITDVDGNTWTGVYIEDSLDLKEPFNYDSLYTIGNIKLNPIFSNPDGYNKIALSLSGDAEDTRLVLDSLLAKWDDAFIDLGDGIPVNINEAYRKFIDGLSVEVNVAVNTTARQSSLVNEVDNKRLTISGVSSDEEMENMMIYNHAYNAAAQVVNAIDGMLDKLINGTGRVGL